MTRVSATARLGFAYARSSGGVSYQDMRSLFEAPGMFDISTSFSSTPLYAEDPKMVDDQRLTTLNTPWDEEALRGKRVAAETNPAVTLDCLRKEEEKVGAILRGGGIMLAGTDSPLDSVATALHLDLRAQVKYGIEPWWALQTATCLAAKALGVGNDLGTVEPVKIADLALVSGDPLRDL